MLTRMSETSTIAVIAGRDGQDLQALMSAATARWHRAGMRLAGLLAEGHDGEGVCSAAYLRDLTTGERFSIQRDAPPAGTSCHLDASGMEKACDALLPRLTSADIVVLSKFGKLEAAQQGLWRCFSAAAHAGTPLLTTVSSRHAEALRAWAPAARWLEPEDGAIQAWWNAIRDAA
jgi:nucleoside-triphosphatase THEP1